MCIHYEQEYVSNSRILMPTAWDTRLGRDFFAAPLVSELPDGFGSKPNPILLRKGVCEGIASANAKGAPKGAPFALAEAVGFEPTVP